MKKIFLALVFLVSSFSVFAHEDTFISLNPEGRLIGLPSQFLPAQLNLIANQLSVGGNTLHMPTCVSKYFKNPNSYKLFIFSSWYHRLSILPPYIQFKIIPNNKDFEFQLLFNLTNLSPIKFTLITHPNEKESDHHTLEISAECKLEIEKSTVKTNT